MEKVFTWHLHVMWPIVIQYLIYASEPTLKSHDYMILSYQRLKLILLFDRHCDFYLRLTNIKLYWWVFLFILRKMRRYLIPSRDRFQPNDVCCYAERFIRIPSKSVFKYCLLCEAWCVVSRSLQRSDTHHACVLFLFYSFRNCEILNKNYFLNYISQS